MKSKPLASRASHRHQQSPTVLPTVEALEQAFAHFLELEVASGDAAPDTVSTYLRRTSQYLRWCCDNGISPALATVEEIKTYRHYLIKHRKQKSTTIALTLSVLRRFYTAAMASGLVKENPAVGVKPPRQKVDAAERLSYLESGELSKLLATLPSDEGLKSRRDRALLGIMALQGPRTVELHRANVGDLVRNNSNWGLRVEGKGNIRTIPLRQDLAQVLWQYLEAREMAGEELSKDSPLFIALGNRFRGNRLSRRGIRWLVDLYLTAAGLKHLEGRTISAHSLRHTAGTLGLRGGADLRQVQDLLGHSDPKTTAIYAHVNERYANNPALGIDVEI